MRVFRVEHKDGKGPYYTRGAVSEEDKRFRRALGSAHDDDSHPAFWDVMGRTSIPFTQTDEEIADYYCACDSLEQLIRWFDGFWGPLSYFGYFIASYDVDPDDVIEGGYGQVLFYLPASRRVERIPA